MVRLLGLGLDVGLRDGQLVVTAVAADSLGEMLRVPVGARILRVGQQAAEGLDLAGARALFPPDREVILDIQDATGRAMTLSCPPQFGP